MQVSIDFEVYSSIDLKAVGADVNLRHPDTRVLCMAYSTKDGGVDITTNYDEMREIIHAASSIRAWNASYEVGVIRDKLGL